MQSLETWQDFHPHVRAAIDQGMGQTNRTMRTSYNDFKRANRAALGAHTMLILPRRQGNMDWT